MSAARLGVVAAVTGAAVMVIELMAVRLMAPWFGQSQIVWTNVIGVVLASLALGQWLGGRFAEGRRGPGPAGLLLAAGAVALALPDLVGLLAAATLPDDLGLLEAHPFVSLGSLLVSVLGLGIPMVALGAITPWLVRVSKDAMTAPGRVAGQVLGAGTAGSLLGTFGATHLLLPWVGSAGAVRVAGAVLVAASVLTRGAGPRLRASSWLWLSLPVAASAVPSSAPAVEGRTLAVLETPYQLVRIEEGEDGARLLRLNEGLDSYHSMLRPGELWTGAYFDAFLMPSLLGAPAEDGRRDVLVVGLAAGTMATQLLRVDPTARVEGVEIDEALVRLGRRWFDLPEEVTVLAGLDGRVALQASTRRYGAILVDAYAQQIYLPAHLCTLEFFTLLRERLRPGGVAALNVGGLSVEDPVVHEVAGTFGRVFPGAEVARVPGSRNMIVLGWKGQAPGAATIRGVLGEAGVDEHLAWTYEGGLFGPVPQARRVLRDGVAPVEALAHDSWQGRTWTVRGGDATGAPGDPAETLDRARQLLSQTRWSEAEVLLRLLTASQVPLTRADAWLLLGNTAFERRQLGRARDAYERVMAETAAQALPDAQRAAGLQAAAQANLTRLTRLDARREALDLRVTVLLVTLVALLLLVVGLALAGVRRERAAQRSAA